MFVNIFVSLLGIYALRMLYFIVGAAKKNSKPIYTVQPGKERMISIVVPTRNEEERIEDCIRSIACNNYPIDNYEVIAVNDRSEDETGQLLKS